MTGIQNQAQVPRPLQASLQSVPQGTLVRIQAPFRGYPNGIQCRALALAPVPVPVPVPVRVPAQVLIQSHHPTIQVAQLQEASGF